MNKILMLLMVIALVSCGDNDALKMIERIKDIGNNDPEQALLMLDSIKSDMTHESEYIRMKCTLLDIRLKDKADIVPTSDSTIKVVTRYFEKRDNVKDIQEAYYYAGSVYRDLQDIPRSLEYFFKSLDCANNRGDCDSILLRNAYSNLNDLYYKVQNYNDAVKMAQMELNIALLLKKNVILPYLHLGTAYRAQGKLDRASEAFDTVFDEIANSKQFAENQLNLFYLLNFYSLSNKTERARECLSLIKSTPINHISAFPCMSLARYYKSIGLNDSAIIYGKLVMDNETDIYNMYDASKLLYRIYSIMGDVNNASHYAGIYMQLSDSLDFGKRQELAATVNNQYKYQRDAEEERHIIEVGQRNRNMMWAAIVLAICTVLGGAVYYQRRRNKYLEEVLNLSNELTDTKAERDKMKGNLQNINAEIDRYRDEIKNKEQLLAEKLEENKRFITLLHKAELEERAEDVVTAIKQASEGKHRMSSSDWQRFYHAVDELQPDLMERIAQHLGKFTEQQQQVCYLLSIGLTNTQIENLTDIPHVTVWRWVKKFDWVQGEKG